MPVYDWRQLQRWRISEALLPPGSVIRSYEPGLWEKYRLQVVGALAVILLQGSLIAWLAYEHRRRTLAEVRSRKSMAELTRMNRVATAGELSASIAHEIGQPVTGMVLQASAAQRWLAGEKPDVEKVRGALGEIVRAGQNAADIIRSVNALFRKDTEAPKTAVNLNNLITTVLAIVRVDLQAAQVRVETAARRKPSRRERQRGPAATGHSQSRRECGRGHAHRAASPADDSDRAGATAA